MHKKIMILVGLIASLQVQAFPCFLTMVKDNCWANYNVTVEVTNATTGKLITTIIVPQGQPWVRQQFVCQPADTISLTATFTPVFWQSDKDKVYAAQHTWTFPQAVAAGDTAWNINVCYPAEFSEVPLPPEAGANCKCDIDSIPPVKPQ